MSISLASFGEPRATAITRRRLGVGAVFCAFLPATWSAAALNEADSRDVRQVVEAQLQAFAQDDAGLAYSYASPEIQAQFRDANNFMAMVRSGYPMVIRPAAVSFFQPRLDERTPESVKQLVRLRDHEGRLWIATYLLQRQAGAGWRISGCVVVPDSDRSST